MKYAPHPWDRYGSPNIVTGTVEVDDRVELEERLEELLAWVKDKEDEIGVLEDEVSAAEIEIYEIQRQLGTAPMPGAPGQTRHSDEC